MTKPPTQSWSIDVYRVSDGHRQQNILSAFLAIGRPDVTALGTQSGPDWFVVVETSTDDDRRWARHTVSLLDAGAYRAYAFGRPRLLGSPA